MLNGGASISTAVTVMTNSLSSSSSTSAKFGEVIIGAWSFSLITLTVITSVLFNDGDPLSLTVTLKEYMVVVSKSRGAQMKTQPVVSLIVKGRAEEHSDSRTKSRRAFCPESASVTLTQPISDPTGSSSLTLNSSG